MTTPGRQIVGGELFVEFDVAADTFAFVTSVFGAGDDVLFANDVIANIPTTGVNVIVLQTTDNDGDPGTPFGAGTAANLIAAQTTADRPGFFIYFNSGLDLPRLVFSTNLNDATSDLKVLARLTNLVGRQDALPTFSAANFTMLDSAVPVSVPDTPWLLTLGILAFAFRRGGHPSGPETTAQA